MDTNQELLSMYIEGEIACLNHEEHANFMNSFYLVEFCPSACSQEMKEERRKEVNFFASLKLSI